MSKTGRSRSVERPSQRDVSGDEVDVPRPRSNAVTVKKPEQVRAEEEHVRPRRNAVLPKSSGQQGTGKDEDDTTRPRRNAIFAKRPPPPPEEDSRTPASNSVMARPNRKIPREPLLLKDRYAITVHRWNVTDGALEAAGTILSQTMQNVLSDQPDSCYAGDITLAEMRKMTPGMSSFPRVHKFCLADGSFVSDESTALDAYFALNAEEDAESEKSDAKQKADTKPTSKEDEIKKEGAPKEGVAKSDDVKPPDDKTKQPADDKDKQPTDDKDKQPTDDKTKQAADDKTKQAADNKDKQPADDKKKKPSAKPAVPRLSLYYRSTISAKAAGTEKATAPTLDMKMRDNPSAMNLETLAAPAAVESMIAKDDTLKAPSTGNEQAITAGTLSESEWTMVLRNCSVFYGWKIDAASQRITRAPRAAFRLRVADDTSTLSALQPLIKQKDPLDAASYEESDEDEPDQALLDKIKATSLRAFDKTPSGIPNFRTNDDSKIEITACASALAVSLAKSDFSSQSTEASANGGFGGISVGVSAGYASSKSNAHKEEHETQTQTLIARYMYPRCDIFLRPEDLEPTPEFTELLRRVKDNRSLDALRQIQAQYGQLFCQELTLGARLLSTKVISATKDASVDSQKEQFKVSVGASVQTPYGGATMKHEEESGSTNDSKRTTTNSRETNVFEACGGDTILANNASAWAASVAKPALWRVINREGLSTLVDMLSEMPGFQAAQMWFVQAIPALSKYIRLNAALSTNVRFKVESPRNSLACQNDGTAMFYLGCSEGATVTPRLNGRKTTVDMFWLRIDLENTRVLFNPATYRAPTIFGFKDFNVGDGPFGSKYNAAFAGAQWELVSPFGVEMPGGSPYELKNMARVILRTVPFRDPSAKLMPDGTDPTPPSSHMVVFRNVQGVFLPAISDHDEYQYWRIEKTDDSPAGTPIKGGDSIRLSWRFADQVVGFRDYKDDVFGRRRNCCPAELESSKLYMKVPWPRFEKSENPTALVMSTQASKENIAESLPVLPGTFNYLLQDLTLRIDTMENGSLGDSHDYMLRGLTQGLDQMGAEQRAKALETPIEADIFPRSPQNPLQVWSKIAALGTIDAPAPRRSEAIPATYSLKGGSGPLLTTTIAPNVKA